MVIKTTIWAYLEPLVYSEDYIHLAEVSKKLNKNHSVARQYLNYLEKEGIVLKKIVGRLTMYKINTNLPNIIDVISIIEKEKLIKKCKQNLIIKEIVSFLHNNLNEDNKALIFGSSAEDAKKANDIDILITDKITMEEKLKNLEKEINIKIHLINVKGLKSINESLKNEIRKKHLIIQGSEEVIKWLI